MNITFTNREAADIIRSVKKSISYHESDNQDARKYGGELSPPQALLANILNDLGFFDLSNGIAVPRSRYFTPRKKKKIAKKAPAKKTATRRK